jgi:hypothetical protein
MIELTMRVLEMRNSIKELVKWNTRRFKNESVAK